MKVAICPGNKRYVKALYQAAGEMGIEILEEMPIEQDLIIAPAEPKAVDARPIQDWRGEGKQKMRRQR